MKVKYLFGMAALLFGAALSSCSSDDFTEDGVEPGGGEPTPQGTIHFSTTVSSKNDNTRALEDLGDKIHAYWEIGDAVAVVDANGGGYLGEVKVTGILDKIDNSAIIEGEINEVLQDQQVKLIYPAAAVNTETGEVDVDYSQQDGTLECIEEKYAVAESEASGVNILVKDGTPIASLQDRVHFTNKNGILRFKFKYQGTEIKDIYKFALVGENGVLNYIFLKKPSDVIYLAMEPMKGQLKYRILAGEVASTGDVVKNAYYEGSANATVKAGAFYDLYYLALGKMPFKEVNLGLSVNWAAINVGALLENYIGDLGDYFAWGEVTGYSAGYDPNNCNKWRLFDLENYKYSGTGDQKKKYTKYCPTKDGNDWGGDGQPDDVGRLVPEDDAAHMNWGGDWRMPNDAEVRELIDNTTTPKWVTIDGVSGWMITSKINKETLFLPAAGVYTDDSGFLNKGSNGHYWSTSLFTGTNPIYARHLFVIERYNNDGSPKGPEINDFGPRHFGYSVRAVRPNPDYNK